MGEQGGGNVLMGMIPGFGQGYQQAQEAKKKNTFIAAQTDLIKQEAKAKEKALIVDSMKAELLAGMTPEQRMSALFPKADDSLESKLATILKFAGGQAGNQSASVPLPDYAPGSGTGPTRPGAMGIPQQIAQGQVGGGDFFGLTKEDFVRGLLKKEVGAEPAKYSRTAQVYMPDGNPGTAPMNDRGVIDLSKAVPLPFKPDMQTGVGAGMAPTQTPVNPYSRAPMGAPIQTGPPPNVGVDVPTPGGGTVKKFVNPFGGGGSAVSGTTMGGGGIQTKLDLMDIPLQAEDVSKWTDGKGGNPPPGWTPRQAQSRGYKPAFPAMSADATGKGLMISQAISDLEVVEKLLFPKPGVFNRTLALGARGNLPEWAVKDAQTVMSNMQNAVNAKLRIETGAQANPSETENIMARFFPSGVKDSEASARNKVSRLKDFMVRGKFVLDPQGKLVIVEPPKEAKKPDLSLGKKKDPAAMSDAELLKALQ